MTKLIYKETSAPNERPEAYNLLLNADAPRPKRWLFGLLVLPILIGFGYLAYSSFSHTVTHPREEPPKKFQPAVDYTLRMAEDGMEKMRADIERLHELDPNWRPPRKDVNMGAVPKGYFRVAAVQIATKMGDLEYNRKALTHSIRLAAEQEAKLIVLPEASVPGYADLETWTFWSDDPEGDLEKEKVGDGQLNEYSNNFMDVRRVAEPRDGASFQHFSALAKELGVYLLVPYIESEGSGEDETFYNAATLINDQGEAILHYRKQHLWALGDPWWASEQAYETQPTVETPFGKIGVMICYDMHQVLPELAKEEVDIILHPAAFYGMNFEGFLVNKYARKVRRSGANLVLANWGSPFTPIWEGYGLSRVIRRDGKLVAARSASKGEYVLIADLPYPDTKLPAPAPKTPPASAPATQSGASAENVETE